MLEEVEAVISERIQRQKQSRQMDVSVHVGRQMVSKKGIQDKTGGKRLGGSGANESERSAPGGSKFNILRFVG